MPAASKVFSSLAPWFARMCGHTQQADTPDSQTAAVPPANKVPTNALPKEQSNPAAAHPPNPKQLLPIKKVAAREVLIDTETAVPYELYRDLVRAGRRAKARGQHELKESPVGATKSMMSSHPPKMHLVRPAGSCSSW